MSKDLMIADDFFDEKQLQLIKDSFGKGLTNDEFKLFLYVAQHTKLDPMLKQIYAIKYGSNPMSIITAIDGYRIVAERTGRYCPGKSASFHYDKNGNLFSAIAYVRKMTLDGTWHEVEGLALYSEYVQRKSDGKPNKTWDTRAHGQLAKCAEALALRKAFPNDLSAIRTEDEMGKVIDEGEAVIVKEQKIEEKISNQQVEQLSNMLASCESDVVSRFEGFIKNPPINAQSLSDIPVSQYQSLLNMVKKRYSEAMAKMSASISSKDTLQDISFNVEEFEREET